MGWLGRFNSIISLLEVTRLGRQTIERGAACRMHRDATHRLMVSAGTCTGAPALSPTWRER